VKTLCRTLVSRARRTGGYWPHELQELLLRAATLDGADAIAAWRALRPRLDPARAERATRRLLPLLGANLGRLGIEDPLLAPIESLRRETAERNRRLFDAGRRLLTALAEASIDALVLKGGALVSLGYHDPGVRPMSDLDIVVPTRRARAALEALARAGWTARDPVTEAFLRMQHATDIFEAGTSLKCDLHWHVYWECCRPDDDDDLWAASVPLDFDGVAARALDPADQALHLCVHGSRRARRPTLSWIPDVLLVLRAGGVDWSRLVAQASRRRFTLRAATMLDYLARVFHAPVPDEALAGLGALPVSALERFEYWIGNRPQGLLGELPNYWCNYRRLRHGGSIGSPLDFPRYLQQTWKLGSLREVGVGALARAHRRARAAVLGAPPDRRASRS
jgi:hypothetical protein